jgi:hypothetical protein
MVRQPDAALIADNDGAGAVLLILLVIVLYGLYRWSVESSAGVPLGAEGAPDLGSSDQDRPWWE